MRVALRTLVLALAASSALATNVAAQEDGVTLDPRDPAAKEYALPVESARRDASGEQRAGVQHGSTGAEPFGAGVTPSGQSTAEAGQNAGTAAGATDAEPATAESTPAGGASTAAGATPSQVQASTDGPGSTAALIGGGLAALLIVGIGGLALRATRGPDQP